MIMAVLDRYIRREVGISTGQVDRQLSKPNWLSRSEFPALHLDNWLSQAAILPLLHKLAYIWSNLSLFTV